MKKEWKTQAERSRKMSGRFALRVDIHVEAAIAKKKIKSDEEEQACWIQRQEKADALQYSLCEFYCF